MSKKIRTRVLIILVVTLAESLYGLQASPPQTVQDFSSWTQVKENLTENIQLGLDLKGGSHLVMQVQTDEVIKGISSKNAETALAKLNEKSCPSPKSKPKRRVVSSSRFLITRRTPI